MDRVGLKGETVVKQVPVETLVIENVPKLIVDALREADVSQPTFFARIKQRALSADRTDSPWKPGDAARMIRQMRDSRYGDDWMSGRKERADVSADRG